VPKRREGRGANLGDGDMKVVVVVKAGRGTPPGKQRANLFETDMFAPLPVLLRAPCGDMMLTGYFWLLAAVTDAMPELAEPIQASRGRRRGAALWEL
jgi:hypothetical protein